MTVTDGTIRNNKGASKTMRPCFFILPNGKDFVSLRPESHPPVLAEHSGGGISLIVSQLHIDCQKKVGFCPYRTELKERKSKKKKEKAS